MEEAFFAALGMLGGYLRGYEEVGAGRHQRLGSSTVQAGEYPLETALRLWHLELKDLFTTQHEGGAEGLRGTVRTRLARHPIPALPPRLEAVVRTLEALHPQRDTNVVVAIDLIHNAGPNPYTQPPEWRETMEVLAYAVGLAYGRPGARLPACPAWSRWDIRRVPGDALFSADEAEDDAGCGGGEGVAAPPAGPRR